ncbi:hypothetical protein [Desulfogranum japonicum]|uniref:hypothetical protein n=1 Tax=Desulfogranum japonicum TaxID=231447 RepID=UPI00048DE8D8|nr:hypothetical protein [Desulfogranum japonicum]
MKESRLPSARGKPDGKTGENSSSQPAAVKNVSLQHNPVKSRVSNTPVPATGTEADWTNLYDDLRSAIQVKPNRSKKHVKDGLWRSI